MAERLKHQLSKREALSSNHQKNKTEQEKGAKQKTVKRKKIY
jgi:hypothetical protein